MFQVTGMLCVTQHRCWRGAGGVGGPGRDAAWHRTGGFSRKAGKKAKIFMLPRSHQTPSAIRFSKKQ